MGKINHEYCIQSDHINMSVLIWYLVKYDASVRYCTVQWKSHVVQGTRNTRPCINGH